MMWRWYTLDGLILVALFAVCIICVWRKKWLVFATAATGAIIFLVNSLWVRLWLRALLRVGVLSTVIIVIFWLLRDWWHKRG